MVVVVVLTVVVVMVVLSVVVGVFENGVLGVEEPLQQILIMKWWW